MSAQAVAKELARLSYTDMMILAKQISTRLPQVHTEAVAEVLAELLKNFDNKPNPMDEASNKHLKNVFSSRVKTIHVMAGSTGWTVSFGNHTAVGQRLPDAINQLLDQLTTMKAMGVL